MVGKVRQIARRSVRAALSAACTSLRRAVDAAVEVELNRDVGVAERTGRVISVTPGIRQSRRSSGAATVAA